MVFLQKNPPLLDFLVHCLSDISSPSRSRLWLSSLGFDSFPLLITPASNKLNRPVNPVNGADDIDHLPLPGFFNSGAKSVNVSHTVRHFAPEYQLVSFPTLPQANLA
jgi:hypothetical protein